MIRILYIYIYIVDSQKYTNVLSFFIEKPKEYDRYFYRDWFLFDERN